LTAACHRPQSFQEVTSVGRHRVFHVSTLLSHLTRVRCGRVSLLHWPLWPQVCPPFEIYLNESLIPLGQTTLDQPPDPNTWPPTSTLAFTLNLAPSVTPNIINPDAPDAQRICPGYKAANIVTFDDTITADLSLAGPACNAYGNEISDLVLEVQYQNAAQLNVKIYPKYVTPSNRSLYILDESLSPSGSVSDGFTASNSDWRFEWTNDPYPPISGQACKDW
jgi:hypothetical protein